MPRTLRDHVESSAVAVIGGSDDFAIRRERLLALRVDGRPAGEHELPDDREMTKRLNEIHGLAHALVGADLDTAVIDVRSLETRIGMATPDFEADLQDGRAVKIEIARLTDPTEKMYIDALGKIARRAEALVLERTSFESLIGADTIHVRFYKGAPCPKEIDAAARELADVVLSETPVVPPSTRLWEVSAKYPILSRLGAHWARSSKKHDGRIMMDPMLSVVRPKLTATFDSLFEKKSKKAADYGDDGMPVWLVMYGESFMTFSLEAVREIAGRKDFDCGPFERVIIGCFTAGVVFEKGYLPRYVSITTS